ncbi:tetratricopeptide repeat protein [uncultured Winogradskyella sp.]|uniref:tetratricopeptide repeat protein n=1 Tax=uncultured Winogradskyella sp. TaxID=395353 RepID=UPI002615064C|nr:tetratricopeptide repeat protein [uncultured Winogradskyella sp.]
MSIVKSLLNVLSAKNEKFFQTMVDKFGRGLILGFIVLSSISYSQNKKLSDSLNRIYNNLEDGIPKVKTLEELFYANVYNNPKEGEKYARQSRILTKKLDNNEGYGVAIYHIGVSKQLQTQLDSALLYYDEASKFFKRFNDLPHYASTISAIADIERRKGNYKKAIKYTKEAYIIQKNANDQLRYGIGVGDLASIYSDMGNKKLAIEKSIEALKILDTVKQEPWRKTDLLRQIGRIELSRQNFEESLEYLNKALKVYQDTNDNIWSAYTLTDIGNNYLDSKKYDEAENTYIKSLKIAEEYDLLDTKANLYNNLGVINYEKGNFSKARQQINDAMAYNKSKNLTSSVLDNLIALSRIELKTKNYNTLNSLIQKGFELSDSIKQMDLKKEFHFFKSKLHEGQGQYKEALNQNNLYIKISDSLLKINNAKQIDEIKISFETEQKEKELIIKEKEITLLEERKQKAENQRLFFIITAGGILLFALSVIYGLRQKMKRNKTEREKLDIDLEFKEKQLTTHALHLAHKNEVLLDLKDQLKVIKSESNNSRGFQNIINNINLDINNDNNWEQFKSYFEDVHKGFNTKIIRNYPEVSNNDLRLMSLLKMNLSSKEIANILNISTEGVKKARYRLRKKLNLSTEESLQELVLAM